VNAADAVGLVGDVVAIATLTAFVALIPWHVACVLADRERGRR